MTLFLFGVAMTVCGLAALWVWCEYALDWWHFARGALLLAVGMTLMAYALVG